jgi:hypothetical protein
MNIYCPALGFIFSFFIWTSRTLEGWRMSLEMYVTCRAIINPVIHRVSGERGGRAYL